ncbi:MAG: TrkA family potassium uptake protein [Lachnospiraceae bacterium]|nr:TrkA family potassium uptake protein [Lachnospiraceae bacterium]MBQ8413313.1 TrkA family potassium uptake protein [Lachnospiraceae bacterium]
MKKSFAVIGMGRFGRSISMELYRLGADVMVIDKDEEKINRMSDYVTCAINIDVCDTDALINVGLSNMDAVIVSMADYLEPSVMSVISAKDLGVPFVIAKARDEITGNILDKVGADKVVFPERESGVRLSRKLMSSDFLEFFELSDKVSLIELMPKEEWIGKSLKELNLRKEYKINVIAIKEHEDINVVLDPDEPLKADCPLVVTINKADIKRLM